jgi:hypothetical protein
MIAMGKIKSLLLVSFCFIPLLYCYGQEKKPDPLNKSNYGMQGASDSNVETFKGDNYSQGANGYKLAPGLETIKVGALSIVAPKGSKVYKRNGQIILEDPAAYLDRKFDAIEKRLNALESNQQDILEQLQRITQFIGQTPQRDAANKK